MRFQTGNTFNPTIFFLYFFNKHLLVVKSGHFTLDHEEEQLEYSLEIVKKVKNNFLTPKPSFSRIRSNIYKLVGSLLYSVKSDFNSLFI